MHKKEGVGSRLWSSRYNWQEKEPESETLPHPGSRNQVPPLLTAFPFAWEGQRVGSYKWGISRITSVKRFRNRNPEMSLEGLHFFSPRNATVFDLPVPSSLTCDIHRISSTHKSQWWLWIIPAVILATHSEMQKSSFSLQVLVISPPCISPRTKTSSELFTSQAHLSWHCPGA